MNILLFFILFFFLNEEILEIGPEIVVIEDDDCHPILNLIWKYVSLCDMWCNIIIQLAKKQVLIKNEQGKQLIFTLKLNILIHCQWIIK